MASKTFIVGKYTQLTREIATILNLDPDRHPVNSITIELRGNEAAYAVVKMFVTTEQDKSIAEIIKRYELVEPR